MCALLLLRFFYRTAFNQEEWVLSGVSAGLRVLDGDRMRRDGVNRRTAGMKTPSKLLIKELQWM